MAISVVIATSRARASLTGELDSARSTIARNWSSLASGAASRIVTRTDRGPAWADGSTPEDAAEVGLALHAHVEIGELDAVAGGLHRHNGGVARRKSGSQQPARRGSRAAAAERLGHVAGQRRRRPLDTKAETILTHGRGCESAATAASGCSARWLDARSIALLIESMSHLSCLSW